MMERLSETCTAIFNKLEKIVHLVGFVKEVRQNNSHLLLEHWLSKYSTRDADVCPRSACAMFSSNV